MVRTGEKVHVNFKLGNCNQGRRDFTTSGLIDPKDTLTGVTLPTRTSMDMVQNFYRTAKEETEGHWSKDLLIQEPGVTWIEQSLDQIIEHDGVTMRGILTAKAFVIGCDSLDQPDSTLTNATLDLPMELVLESSPLPSLDGGAEICVRLLRDSIPQRSVQVSFLPQGIDLQTEDDASFERETDGNGIARYRPDRAGLFLISARILATNKNARGPKETYYSTSLTLQVTNRALTKDRSSVIAPALPVSVPPKVEMKLDHGIPPSPEQRGEVIETKKARYSVGILLYEGFEVLDTYGPIEMWGNVPEFDLFTVSEKKGPVRSAQGIESIAMYAFEEAPRIDILLVPGGIGTMDQLSNTNMIDFLQKRHVETIWTTSVCTGSALLAKAGILNGLRATSNKAFFSIAKNQSNQVQWVNKARWVEDGKVFTSSGVSAGTDMSLALVRRIFGIERAMELAKVLEYQWQEDQDVDPFALESPANNKSKNQSKPE
jgi:putative intracellular protease/amidase